MGNTLIDEPVPPTLSEPFAADRPTLDDPTEGHRPTIDDIPENLRGPSPTLVDGPPDRASATHPDAGPPLHTEPEPPAQAPPPETPAPGILAQLPPMPEARPGPSPFAQPQAVETPPAQAASPAEAPQNTPQTPQPPAAQRPALAPGSRTLLGVAPPPPQHATTAGAASFRPPGQTSTPSPTDPTLPTTNAVERPALAPPAPAEDAQNTDEGAPPDASGQTAAAEQNTHSAGPDEAPSPPRKRRARTVIAVVFAVLGVLAIVGVTAAYFLFFRYTPLASHHIPAATNLVVRADVRQIGTFGPIKKHLWSLVLDRASQKIPGKSFADRVADATGISPALDARELIVASVDAQSWVALIGGNFEPGTFVSGMQKVLGEEGIAGWHKEGDLLIGPGSVALAQADDGTIIIGTEAEIVKAALPSSDDHKKLGLPAEGALAFAVSKEAWEQISHETAAIDPSGALRRIRHVHGTFTLTSEPSIDIGIEPKGGESPEALAKDIEQLFVLLRAALVLVTDQMGEKTALSAAKVTVTDGEVHVHAAWPMEGLDRGAEKLAETLRF